VNPCYFDPLLCCHSLQRVFLPKPYQRAFDKLIFKRDLQSFYQYSIFIPEDLIGVCAAFGVCITELADGLINVIYADGFPRPDLNQMINITVKLVDQYHITFENNIFVDGATLPLSKR
jgi:hypothetical protein